MSHDDLRQAVEHLHGCTAKWQQDVEVDERFGGDVVWQGTVSVFAVLENARATRAFAWSYVTDEATQRRKFIAILAIPPVNTPVDAVRAAIASGQQD